MQGIQTLIYRKQTVAAREGTREGITGDQYEGGHMMSRGLLLAPTGESLNSSSESIIHYMLINWL